MEKEENKTLEKNFTSFVLYVNEEGITIKPKGRGVELSFNNKTKDFAFITHLLYEEQKEGIDIDSLIETQITTQLLSLDLIWDIDFVDYVWERGSKINEQIKDLSDEEQSEEEIIDEMKKIYEYKEILDKAEPTDE